MMTLSRSRIKQSLKLKQHLLSSYYSSSPRFNKERLRVSICAFETSEKTVLRAYNRLFESAFGFDLDEYHQYWCAPRYLVSGFLGSRLVSAYFGVVQPARMEGKEQIVAGLGGLVCSPHLRRRGIASKLVRDSWPVIVEQSQADLSLLICNPKSLSFYKKLGWHLYQGDLRYQETEKTESMAFDVMIQKHEHLEAADPDSVRIDGPLW